MKKKETCRRAELLVLMILEARIHERRQEDDKKEVEVFFDISCCAIIFVSIERYNNYIGQKGLSGKYAGTVCYIDSLIVFFDVCAAQLECARDWCNYLNYCVEEQDKKERNAEDGWGNFVNDQLRWQYSDFINSQLAGSGLLVNEEERQST